MSASPPLVSIVTPVLNRASTISRCLASVAAQSYKNLEHLVVDGGSNDGTLDIVRAFESPHRLRWISEPDGGMYEAINKGFTLAGGEIFAYLNSDDMYFPWTVDCAVSVLKTEDMIFGDLALISEIGKRRHFALELYGPFDFDFYSTVGVLAQPTVFWQRSVHDRVGEFDTTYRLIADCDYWLRAAESGIQPAHIEEVMAVQSDHEETLRARNASELNDEFLRLRSRYESQPGLSSPKWAAHVRYSWRWRVRLLGFYGAYRNQTPHRWTHFQSFLRRWNLGPRFLPLFLFLLPKALRGRSPGWTSGIALEEAVAAEAEKRSGLGT